MNEYNNMFNNAAVVDLGSAHIKADFSGEEFPKTVFPSLIGRPKFNKILPLTNETEMVGPNADIRGLYKLERPIKRGVLAAVADGKLLFNKIYADLKIINNKEVPMFIAEPPFTSKAQKRAIAEILFESHDCPFIFFGIQGVLSLYAFGKTDGVVLESGEGVTQVVPIFNGYKLDHAVEKLNFGGEDIASYLKLLLRKNGTYIQSSSEECLFSEIKKSVCELKTMSTEDMRSRGKMMQTELGDKKGDDVKYLLPDGTTVEIGAERFLAPEILFNPSLAGLETPGLHELLDGAIKKLDLDLRKNLYSNIYLSGGNTHIHGFAERFANELSSLISDKTKMSIVAPNVDRTFLAWQGGSIITNMNSFSKLWISRKEMYESGDRIFFTKAF